MLFDLDGVLVDSTVAVARWWRVWADENKIDVEKVLKVIHGRRTVEVVRLMAPHLDPEAEAKRIEQRASGHDDRDGVIVMPGAAELLKSLPGDRWAVVTSGTRRPALARLQSAGLPAPRVLVGADDVSNGKPAPEPYLKGAQLLGMKPAECLVIEDAPVGIQSGHAGAMKVIGIASTYPAAELSDADAVAQELRQIRVRLQDGKLQVDL
jgi:sugar-phosphatase